MPNKVVCYFSFAVAIVSILAFIWTIVTIIRQIGGWEYWNFWMLGNNLIHLAITGMVSTIGIGYWRCEGCEV